MTLRQHIDQQFIKDDRGRIEIGWRTGTVGIGNLFRCHVARRAEARSCAAIERCACCAGDPKVENLERRFFFCRFPHQDDVFRL